MNSLNQHDVETTSADDPVIQLLQSFDPPIPAPAATRPWHTKGVSPMHQFRSRWLQSPTKAFALAFTLLSMVAGIGFGLFTTRRVSAAEIIANNRQRLESDTTFGLQGYRGTITSAQNGKFQANANLIVQGDQSRIEVCRGVKMVCELFISTPTSIWEYNPQTKTGSYTTYGSPRPADDLSGGMVTGNSLDQIMAGASLDADVELEGTASVANRPAYILLIDPDMEEAPTLRVAVDQEYFITLQITELTAEGTEVGVIGFSELEINPTIDPAIFEFVPPADATIQCRQSLTIYESTQVEVDGQTVPQTSVMQPIDPATGEVMQDQAIDCPSFGE